MVNIERQYMKIAQREIAKDGLHNPRESVVVRIVMGRKASFHSQ